jgi:hypothetical protein
MEMTSSTKESPATAAKPAGSVASNTKLQLIAMGLVALALVSIVLMVLLKKG